jgi:hypothetical protein
VAPLVDLRTSMESTSTQGLADLIQTTFAGPTFLRELAVVDVADPNHNHLAIAAMAEAGYVRAVLTTNFDTLLERLASTGERAFTVLTPGNCHPGPDGTGVPLFKLHGSADDPMGMLETSTHKSREMDRALPKAWRPYLNGADLLVVGSSGADLPYGAVRAFFTNFLSGGGRRIYWLHRSDTPPELGKITPHVIFVQGMLPDFLSDLAQALGQAPGCVRPSGRNAMEALHRVMDTWSREPHIGKWAAASFLLSLARTWGRPRGSLVTALLRMAADQGDIPIEARRLPDLAVTTFLQTAAMVAVEHGQRNAAKKMLNGCIDIYSAAVAGVPRFSARMDEMAANLSTTFTKLGLIYVVGGDRDQAHKAFQQSAVYAYMAGHVENFLLALGNILDHHFKFDNILRCLPLAEGMVTIADRLGISVVAIEGRLRLAAYHLVRNEIWTAKRLLNEARDRATINGRHDAVIVAEVLLAASTLKTGQISEGLSLMATSLDPLGTKPFLSNAFELARILIIIMGIPQATPYRIDCSQAMVSRHVAAMEAEVARAKESGGQPWEGNHCFVPETATALGKEKRNFLIGVGVECFGGVDRKAIRLGLSFGKHALAAHEPNEARWATRNVLDHPNLPPEERALALHLHGVACAQSGRLDQTDESFAELLADVDGASDPAIVSEAQLWHAVQSGDLARSQAWAGHLATELAAQPDPARISASLVSRLESWGGQISAVAHTFQPLAGDLDPDTARSYPTPYRYFRAFPPLFDPQVVVLLDKAFKALDDGLADSTWTYLDEIDALACSEYERGLKAELRVFAMASDVTPTNLDRALDPERARMLGDLDFTALARLETTLCSHADNHQEAELIAAVLSRRAFIADLAGDITARTVLQLVTAMHMPTLDPAQAESQWCAQAGRNAVYYGLREPESVTANGDEGKR